MKGRWFVPLLAVTVAGCGGQAEGCVALKPEVAQAVVDGARGDLQVRPNTGWAIRADSGVYYTAFRIVAAGSDEVGVWAVDSINPPGAIRSVNGYAQQFTTWPVLDGGSGSDAADDAVACLDD